MGMLPPSDSDDDSDEDGGDPSSTAAAGSSKKAGGQSKTAGKLPPSGSEEGSSDEDESSSSSEEPLNEYLASSAPRRKYDCRRLCACCATGPTVSCRVVCGDVHAAVVQVGASGKIGHGIIPHPCCVLVALRLCLNWLRPRLLPLLPLLPPPTPS